MKAIIFGINSQDGFFLSDICTNIGIEVIGVSRTKGKWLVGSVSDREFTTDLIKNTRPDYIFHLAANSTTRHTALYENHATITTGTINILESVKQYSPLSKVFITGSGLQFVNDGRPIKETDEFEAGSAYAMSRIQSVYAARYYRKLGLAVYVGYLFHHESPLRKEHHVSKYVAEAVKQIMSGSDQKITIGDISVKKEWAYAGDISEGIFALVSQDTIFEATLGTGMVYSIGDWINSCFDLAGKNPQDYVVVQDNKFEAEYPVLVSDPSTMRSIGWEAKTSFVSLAAIMMAGSNNYTIS